MYNLIKKDIKAHFRTITTLFIFSVIFLIYTFLFDNGFSKLTGNSYLTQCIFFMLYAIILITVFDEKLRGDMLKCSLPVTRRRIVSARYVLTYFVMFSGLIIWLTVAYIINLIFPDAPGDINRILSVRTVVIYLFAVILFMSVFLPARFLVGAVWGLIITIPVFAAIIFIKNRLPFSSPVYETLANPGLPYLIVFFTVFIAAATGLSYYLSVKAFKKRTV